MEERRNGGCPLQGRIESAAAVAAAADAVAACDARVGTPSPALEMLCLQNKPFSDVGPVPVMMLNKKEKHSNVELAQKKFSLGNYCSCRPTVDSKGRNLKI